MNLARLSSASLRHDIVRPTKRRRSSCLLIWLRPAVEIAEHVHCPDRAPRRCAFHVLRVFFPVLCVDTCLLYTSDAADEEDSVDLGGRRIIKKKKKKKIVVSEIN
eukprot:TRINITY_DN1073_c0_g1_i11.p3 TRINITY_DN1073_c0_g1~~TRINITY_DN1073_c0_g1_i11.p3  ORF type:complete len:105 (-),score=18.37 TRINITY_DN1073_c0_g1_i11:65-379(-)